VILTLIDFRLAFLGVAPKLHHCHCITAYIVESAINFQTVCVSREPDTIDIVLGDISLRRNRVNCSHVPMLSDFHLSLCEVKNFSHSRVLSSSVHTVFRLVGLLRDNGICIYHSILTLVAQTQR
jgi:hypothetical protein